LEVYFRNVIVKSALYYFPIAIRTNVQKYLIQILKDSSVLYILMSVTLC